MRKVFLLTLIILLSISSCKKKDSSYSLTISINNNGTVNYESGKYPEGETISLEATPDEGYAFIGWHGEGLEAPTDENPLTIILDSDKSIVANFLNLEDPDYSGMGIWSDEIYSEIIHVLDIPNALTDKTSSDTWTKIVTAFVKDAERHGLDLSYVLDGEISYGIKSNTGAGAWAYNGCRDQEVYIVLNKESHQRNFVDTVTTGDWWYWTIDGESNWGWLGTSSLANPGGRKYKDVPYALKTIWHELGHDILNLAHNCLSNNIMTSSMGGSYWCDESQIKFNGSYSFYSQEPSISWQKAVKDMFEGTNQYCKDCSNYTVDSICYGEFQVDPLN